MRKVLVLLFLVFAVADGYSCSCAGIPPVKESWEAAGEVFRGKIIRADTLLYGNYGAQIYSYTVEILKSYKEEFYKGRELRTILSLDSAACDYMFEVGEEYLIYAGQDSQTLRCSLCSRTKPFEIVKESEIKLLEKLNKEYHANSNGVKTMKIGFYPVDEVDLIKASYAEQLKQKELLIYTLSAFIVVLIVLAFVIARIKIAGK